MTVILKKHKIFYAAIPKVACTSIKHMFFAIENGREFEKMRINGRPRHIHTFYPATQKKNWPLDDIADYRRLTVLREPVERFLSAYSNRVLYHNDVSPAAIKKHCKWRKLEPKPSLELFIEKFERYTVIPAIRRHCAPMTFYLGTDPQYFSKIYPLKQIDKFADDVAETVGQPVTLGRYQTGGPKFKRADLTTKQVQKIERIYKEDYKIYGSYLS